MPLTEPTAPPPDLVRNSCLESIPSVYLAPAQPLAQKLKPNATAADMAAATISIIGQYGALAATHNGAVDWLIANCSK